MSISGAARRNPRMMRPSRSASAWNLTRTTRSLQLGNQIGVRLPRVMVLRLRRALPISKVRVAFLLAREVKCESSVHMLERQCRIALDLLSADIPSRKRYTTESRDTRVSAIRYAPSLRVTYSFGIKPIVTRLQLEEQLC